MNLFHRDRCTKDVRDVWIRVFPLRPLNYLILETLVKSKSQSEYDRLTVAQFLLTEILEHQQQQMDTEINQYLHLLDTLFTGAIRESPEGEATKKLVELLWKHNNEGTIDFGGTKIPELLTQTFNSDRLEDILLEALMYPSDESQFNSLILACSPNNPQIFQSAMWLLFKIFCRSRYHSKVMEFCQTFLSLLRNKYSYLSRKFFPKYLHPVLVTYEYFERELKSENLCRLRYNQPVFQSILHCLESVYNPLNLTRLSHLDAQMCSFYIATACPLYTTLLCNVVQKQELRCNNFPCLWRHLKSGKS